MAKQKKERECFYHHIISKKWALEQVFLEFSVRASSFSATARKQALRVNSPWRTLKRHKIHLDENSSVLVKIGRRIKDPHFGFEHCLFQGIEAADDEEKLSILVRGYAASKLSSLSRQEGHSSVWGCRIFKVGSTACYRGTTDGSEKRISRRAGPFNL
ncbi:hypothetical protein GBA52_015401 [Prunus armeniaca]|nr:hypothetical protein GBA52_015401 [Prunus armeniaca]